MRGSTRRLRHCFNKCLPALSNFVGRYLLRRFKLSWLLLSIVWWRIILIRLHEKVLSIRWTLKTKLMVEIVVSLHRRCLQFRWRVSLNSESFCVGFVRLSTMRLGAWLNCHWESITKWWLICLNLDRFLDYFSFLYFYWFCLALSTYHINVLNLVHITWCCINRLLSWVDKSMTIIWYTWTVEKISAIKLFF